MRGQRGDFPRFMGTADGACEIFEETSLFGGDMTASPGFEPEFPSESVEESVSLSDRFGLWVGFHSIDQDTFLEIIEGYVTHFGINADPVDVRRVAGLRNGRGMGHAWPRQRSIERASWLKNPLSSHRDISISGLQVA